MSEVYVVGGMAMDIEGISKAPIVARDSNPGNVNTAGGGVGRNICENLRRLGVDCGMVSVVGNDDMGHSLIKNLIKLGINTNHVLVLEDEPTAMYISIMDNEGEINVAIAGMDILENIDRKLIDRAKDELLKAKFVVTDTNMTSENLEYLCDTVGAHVPILLDAVSSPKAIKAKNCIGKFHTVKLNKSEAEIVLGIKVSTPEEVEAACRELCRRGVTRAIITMGSEGACYCEGDRVGFVPVIKTEELVSTTGSGDAFSAMLVKGYLEGMDIETTARYATAASSVALRSLSAVSKDMSFDRVKSLLNESEI